MAASEASPSKSGKQTTTGTLANLFTRVKAKVLSFVDGLLFGNDTSALALPVAA